MEQLLDKTAPTEREILGTLKTLLYMQGADEFTKTISVKKLETICKQNHIEAIMRNGVIIGFRKAPIIPRFRLEMKLVQLDGGKERELFSINEEKALS